MSEELREAYLLLTNYPINHWDDNYNRARDELLSLADRYLAIEGWPMEFKCLEHDNRGANCIKCHEALFANHALKDAKLAHLKDKEKYENSVLLKSVWQERLLERLSVEKIENLFKEMSWAGDDMRHKLATAIHKLLTEEVQ